MRHTPFIRIFFPVVIFLTGIFILFTKQEIGYYIFRSEAGSVGAAVIGFTMTLTGVGYALLWYLRSGFATRLYSPLELTFESDIAKENKNIIFDKDKRVDELLKDMEARIESKLSQIEEREGGINPTEKEEMLSSIKENIQRELLSYASSEAEKKILQKASDALRLEKMLSVQDTLRNRLSREIDALSRRGNLNLVLGCLTTVTGLALLGYLTLGSISVDNVGDFALHYTPRITLILFIEVFGYFFLRLYRSSLDDIKYFQNELTNVETKYLALHMALKSGDSKVVEGLISQMAQTERNFVLNKGQTTVELERSKIADNQYKELVETLKAVTKRNNI